jgi:hypothetical protein
MFVEADANNDGQLGPAEFFVGPDHAGRGFVASIGLPVQGRRIACTGADHDNTIAGDQDGSAESIAAAKR